MKLFHSMQMVHFLNDLWPFWAKLADGVKTFKDPAAPCICQKVTGMKAYDFVQASPERAANFSQAMLAVDGLGTLAHYPLGAAQKQHV